MAGVRTHINLKLLPDLALAFPKRAKDFDLPTSTLLGLLVWNDSAAPDPSLKAQAPSRRLNRVSLGCSLRAGRRKMALQRAKEQRLSLNAYLEALIAAELRSPARDLIIKARGA